MRLGVRVLALGDTQAQLSKEALPTDCTYQIKGIRLIPLPLLLMYYKKLLATLAGRLASTLLKNFQGFASHFGCIISVQLCKVNLSQGGIPIIKAV